MERHLAHAPEEILPADPTVTAPIRYYSRRLFVQYAGLTYINTGILKLG